MARFRRLVIIVMLASTTLIPLPAAAARPGVTLEVTIGVDTNPGDEFCAVDMFYQWTGFNRAEFHEVFVFDETLGEAYGIGFDGEGDREPAPLFPGQTGAAMGMLLYAGHTVSLQANLLDRNGRVIAKSNATWPTIESVSCTE